MEGARQPAYESYWLYLITMGQIASPKHHVLCMELGFQCGRIYPDTCILTISIASIWQGHIQAKDLSWPIQVYIEITSTILFVLVENYTKMAQFWQSLPLVNPTMLLDRKMNGLVTLLNHLGRGKSGPHWAPCGSMKHFCCMETKRHFILWRLVAHTKYLAQ